MPSAVAFSIFGQPVRWYGLLFVTAFVVAAWFAWKTRKRHAEAFEIMAPGARNFFDALSALAPLLFAGILGARLYEVFFVSWDFYAARPMEIFAIWNGGLAIQGGMLAAFAWIAWKARGRFLAVADWLAPALALGQAIGRWGNYFNQELFGTPSYGVLSVFVDPARRPASFANYETFHPLFLYESLWLLIVALGLTNARSFLRDSKPGFVFGSYLVLAGTARFFLDFLQWYPASQFAGLRLTQWTALAFAAAGVGLLLWRFRRAAVPCLELRGPVCHPRESGDPSVSGKRKRGFPPSRE